MIIPVTFPSAAIFWLKYNPVIDLEKHTLNMRILTDLPFGFDLPSGISEAEDILYQFKDNFPITVSSPPSKRKYINNKIIKTRICPSHVPHNAFVKISSQLYVASPEYCFLQAATMMNTEQLILFGNELCGKYIHDPNSEYKQRPRTPVTSAASILQFVKSAKGCYGYANALKAASYILDNSNSFMESMLAVFIMLPLHMGGYALKKPELNKIMQLCNEADNLMNGIMIYCDIVWEQEKLIAEYDSDISHLTSEQHRKDKQRASALAISGYTVISITKKNVEFLSELDKTFFMLRRLLGMPALSSRLMKYKSRRKEVLASFRNFRSYDISTYVYN